jgi:hypothetical protein
MTSRLTSLIRDNFAGTTHQANRWNLSVSGDNWVRTEFCFA